MDGWQLPQDYDRLKRQRQDKDMKRASLQETLDRGSSSSKERERGRGGSLFHSQRETSQAKSLKEPIELFSSDLSRDRLARSKVTPAERTIQDQHMMSEDMHDRMDTTSTSTSMPFPAPDFTQDQDTPQPHHRSSQDLLHQIESLRAENSRLHQQHSEQPTTPSRAFFSHYTSHVARTPDRSIGRSRSFSISSPESFARTTSEPDERIIELQNEVDHLRQSRSSQFMELEAMKNKIQKLTSEVMASNNARAAMENSKNAEIETLKSMVVDLEMDVAALQEELEVSHSRMEELEVARVDVQRLQEEKQMLEHEVVTLETERKEVDDLRSQVAEQRARLESRESNTVILKRYNNLEEDYHQLQNDLAVKREELENLRRVLSRQASSAGSFVDVHDEMKELRQDLDMKSALADLQGQRIRSLEELDRRRSAGSEGQSDPRASGRLPKSDDLRLEDLHPPMPTSSSATSTTLSASEPIPGTTAFSRSSSSRPTTAYDEAKVEAMLVAIERLRMERNELRNEVHFLRLEKRFDDPTREQELLSQLEATKARQEKAEEELAHANAMCEEVQSVVSGKESELGSLRSELARTTEELSRVQCLVEELEKTIDEHDGVQSELCSIQAELEASREQLHEAQVERDRLKSRVEALESDCQRLTQDLDRAESRSRELESLVSSTSESTEMEELKQRILRRTEQIGIHQHEIRRLETNLKLTEESLHEITAELKKFEVERDLSRMETAKEKEESDRAKKPRR
ncbi:hypothetical protein FRC03_005432 [Tulasnella sp. 419]|nr:hypothetical protein FRC03_005432 [Tulasnella sp. 419]